MKPNLDRYDQPIAIGNYVEVPIGKDKSKKKPFGLILGFSAESVFVQITAGKNESIVIRKIGEVRKMDFDEYSDIVKKIDQGFSIYEVTQLSEKPETNRKSRYIVFHIDEGFLSEDRKFRKDITKDCVLLTGTEVKLTKVLDVMDKSENALGFKFNKKLVFLIPMITV